MNNDELPRRPDPDDPNITYQIKEIAADDKDGGANARSGPGLGADTPPVTVLPSFGPGTRSHQVRARYRRPGLVGRDRRRQPAVGVVEPDHPGRLTPAITQRARSI
ncbi:MAG: hypothetical protein R2710_02870 [Acidimicrobiales bacterium]